MDLFTVAIGKQFVSKPDAAEIGIVKKEAINNYQCMDITTIADTIGNRGYTFIPHYLEGGMKKDNFKSGQLFLLDFDGAKWDENKGRYIGENISFEEIKQKADEYDLPIAFAYKTLSCPEGEVFYKFRVCFIFEQPVKDIIVAEYIHKALGKIFAGCDTSCCEVSRMFLGGKELIFLNSKARINLMQINHSLYRALRKDDGHFKRALYNFSKKVKIELFDKRNLLAIGYEKDISIFGENIDSTDITLLIGESDFSPIFYVKRHDSINNVNLHQNKTFAKSKLLIEDHVGICPLLEDFYYGKAELSHDERFIIATNLAHYVKGLDLFYKILEKDYPESYKKWERDRTTIKAYQPKSCCENCRYYSECQRTSKYPNIVTKLKNDRRIVDHSLSDYVTLEEAAENVRDNLKAAFESNLEGIHLIKAQTAVGKTFQIRKLIETNPGKRFLIAEPLNRLKREVYDDVKRMMNSAICTPSVRECMYISNEKKTEYMKLHQCGFHREAKRVVRECLDEYKEQSSESEAAIQELEYILTGISAFDEYDVVITTHAMLVNMKEDQLRSFDAIIIDEDILYLQIFSNIKKISKRSVCRLLNSSNREYAHIARTMLGAIEGKYYKSDWNYPFLHEFVGDDNDDWEESEEREGSFAEDDNINDLAIAGSYVLEEDIFYYFCLQTLPKLKYIVLTATCNSQIYRKFFGPDFSVYDYPQLKAKYKGTLKQYTYHSLGRGDLSKKQCLYKYISDHIGSVDIISFKKEESIHSLNSKDIHFGNAIGINDFKGKDLAIVGTPFKNPKAYLLPCCYMYGDNEVNVETRQCNRRINYNDRSFLLTCFRSKCLQEFQNYSLESELEQCIGRARLLRTESTVHLFSAFPCEQAEFITEDYLSAYMNDEGSQVLVA